MIDSTQSGYLLSQLEILNTVFTNAIHSSCYNKTVLNISGNSDYIECDDSVNKYVNCDDIQCVDCYIHKRKQLNQTDDCEFNRINVKLYNHQTALINRMLQYYDTMISGYTNGQTTLYSKIGILGDDAGTGKTLSYLGYLTKLLDKTHLSRRKMSVELTPNSTQYFYSYKRQELSDISSAHLIIVPQNIYYQWKNTIQQYTNLECAFIENKRYLQSIQPSDLCNSDVILTNEKCYEHLQQFASQHGIQWDNVCVDEATNIYLSSHALRTDFQFMWLMTSNWIPLLFKNMYFSFDNLYYIRDRVSPINKELEQWLLKNKELRQTVTTSVVSSAFLKQFLPIQHNARGNMILRTSFHYMRKSVQLPDVMLDSITCLPTITVQSVKNDFMAVSHQITADKIYNLFNSLGIKITSIDDFINMIQVETNRKVDVVDKMRHEDCAVCLDKPLCPTFSKCCLNMFCGQCILKSIFTNNKCPLCRSKLSTDAIHMIRSVHENNNTDINQTTRDMIKNDMNISHKNISQKSKIQTCIDYIKDNDGQMVIYCAFDNIFYQIRYELEKIGIKSESMPTNSNSIQKVAQKFINKEIKVLCISDCESISGLSLHQASHLIFYHEMPFFDSRNNIVHYVQRMGRTDPLRIVNLVAKLEL
jgi:hypothetical protein